MKRFLEWIGFKEWLDERMYTPALVSEGDFWWVRFGENIGREMCGKNRDFSRPAIVLKKLSHELYLVVPTTTKMRHGDWFITITFRGKQECVCLNQIRVIDYRRLDKKLGKIGTGSFDKIRQGFRQLYSF